MEKLDSNGQFIDNLIVSDESTFTLDGLVSAQNDRIWAMENPHLYQETKSFSKKLTIWVAMSSSFVIGPYLFRDEARDPCTVTGDCYVKMQREYLVPELRRKRVTLRNTFFQQDLATHHTSGIAQQFLETKFGERLI